MRRPDDAAKWYRRMSGRHAVHYRVPFDEWRRDAANAAAYAELSDHGAYLRDLDQARHESARIAYSGRNLKGASVVIVALGATFGALCYL